MTPAHSISTPSQTASYRGIEQRLALMVACTVAGGIGLVGLLLPIRWATGAFQSQLPAAILFPLAVSLGALVRLTRDAWRFVQPRHAPRTAWADQLVGWGPSIALLSIALTVSYPGGRTIDWLAWLPLVVLDQFWRQSFFDGGHPQVDPPVSTPADAAPTASPQSSHYLQQTTRLRTETGDEFVAGTVAAEFQAAQRHQSVHVAFCPPFHTTPLVDAFALSGPPAKVKLAQILPHGARFDVRLTAPASQSACVVVEFIAAEPLDMDDSDEATT